MPTPITRLVVLQHVPLEGPVRIATVAERVGLKVEVVRLDQGQPVPAKAPSGAVLVVMGGPMGVGDIGDAGGAGAQPLQQQPTSGATPIISPGLGQSPARYPFLAAEIELLKQCLAEDRPVIGVCLGSQLLAHAAGATVAPLHCGEPPARHREVGWGAIHWLKDPAEEQALSGMERAELVLHWHGDAFTIPPKGEHLAASLACPGQMFRVGRCYGLQFHVEADEATVRSWVEADAEFIRTACGPDGARRIIADTARFMPVHRPRGDRLIGNILRAVMAGGCPG